MRKIKSYEREWMASGELLPIREKKGYCLFCHKKLSIYNLNEYCFSHSLIECGLTDIQDDVKKYEERKVYCEKQRKEYKKKKLAQKDIS